ncbi:MAG: class I SAM-dependent methyltransferase [Bryobacteraceae bacterium]
MKFSSSAEPLDVLRPLLAKYGSRSTLEHFHETVNVVFHDVEADVYDDVHRDMWDSLPEQYRLLLADAGVARTGPSLRILDIGCGTGLSSTLLAGELGPRAGSLHLLDTSPEMLARAKARLSHVPCPVSATLGATPDLDGAARFDLILTCSVLHHIPDLAAFCQDVSRLLAPGGVFLHLQDPCADSAASTQRRMRETEYRKRSQPLIPKSIRRLMPDRVAAAAWRKLRGVTETGYMDRVNTELIRRGTIALPMADQDIWSVTDIHVGNGAGISIPAMANLLPACDLVSQRTYGFFSVLASSLPPSLRAAEAKLIADRSLDGSYVAAAWRKRQR